MSKYAVDSGKGGSSYEKQIGHLKDSSLLTPTWSNMILLILTCGGT